MNEINDRYFWAGMWVLCGTLWYIALALDMHPLPPPATVSVVVQPAPEETPAPTAGPVVPEPTWTVVVIIPSGVLTPIPDPMAVEVVKDCAGQTGHNFGPCTGWLRPGESVQSPGGAGASSASASAAVGGPGSSGGSSGGHGGHGGHK